MTAIINPSHTNDRRRPNLGEQITRLDNMLDGLSEGLNEAVADAVKAGVGSAVKEAVQSVLTEVLTNPELRARLFPPAIRTASLAADTDVAAATKLAGNTQRSDGWWQRVRACIGHMRAACVGLAQTARNAVTDAWRCACDRFAGMCVNCGMLWPFKYQILFALLIGLSLGIGVCHAEPWIAGITSGVGGFVTTLTVQASLWLRKVMLDDPREMA